MNDDRMIEGRLGGRVSGSVGVYLRGRGSGQQRREAWTHIDDRMNEDRMIYRLITQRIIASFPKLTTHGFAPKTA